MARFCISLLLTALLGLGAGLYFPFWSIALVAFCVSSLIPQAPWKALVCGFLAAFLLWAGLALYIDRANDHVLSARISQLVLGKASPLLLVCLTGFVGGVVSGMGALSGSFLHRRAIPK